MKTLLVLFFTFYSLASAQLSQPVRFVTSDPTLGGACTNGESMRLNVSSSPPHLWACGSSVWNQITSSPIFSSGSLTFVTPLADLTCTSQTLAFSGASTGAAVSPRIPATLQSGLIAMALIAATNTLQIRVCNLSGAAVTPISATYGASLINGLTSGSSSLTFGGVGDGTCSLLTFTLTGANTGDAVAPQWPATLPSGFIGMIDISATNTAQVTLCNLSGGFVTVGTLTYGASLLR